MSVPWYSFRIGGRYLTTYRKPFLLRKGFRKRPTNNIEQIISAAIRTKWPRERCHLVDSVSLSLKNKCRAWPVLVDFSNASFHISSLLITKSNINGNNKFVQSLTSLIDLTIRGLKKSSLTAKEVLDSFGGIFLGKQLFGCQANRVDISLGGQQNWHLDPYQKFLE